MRAGWLYDLALYLHLLGAFLLVSGTVVAGAGFEAARRRSSAAEVALLLGLARTGALLVVAGTLLAAGFGLWLVDLGHWGYGSAWVEASIGLLAAIVALGALGGQGPKRARRLASQLAADDRPASDLAAGHRAAGDLPPGAELRRMLDDRRMIAVNYLAAALLLAIVALMVVRPGAPPR